MILPTLCMEQKSLGLAHIKEIFSLNTRAFHRALGQEVTTRPELPGTAELSRSLEDCSWLSASLFRLQVSFLCLPLPCPPSNFSCLVVLACCDTSRIWEARGGCCYRPSLKGLGLVGFPRCVCSTVLTEHMYTSEQGRCSLVANFFFPEGFKNISQSHIVP